MDLNVGEYIRTKNGYIGKIENINDFRPPESKYAIDIQMGDLVFIGEDLIAKNSEDIIDLIEVGDYVNEERVIQVIQQNAENKNFTAICVQEPISLNSLRFYNKDIQTIVTHEQMKSMEYRVGEEDE